MYSPFYAYAQNAMSMFSSLPRALLDMQTSPTFHMRCNPDQSSPCPFTFSFSLIRLPAGFAGASRPLLIPGSHRVALIRFQHDARLKPLPSRHAGYRMRSRFTGSTFQILFHDLESLHSILPSHPLRQFRDCGMT